ncbi:MAG: sigma-70 family RNA polymerase sigma factor [Chitinivibrionales bacterium]|nr:sigma-70 family RNA polymerase sigma factor [Chitinivibrionales bacterium]MBD3395311.1 sigma-70 family RNA polymerase sigma factor [Chitinivibrionales bacterium]
MAEYQREKRRRKGPKPDKRRRPKRAHARSRRKKDTVKVPKVETAKEATMLDMYLQDIQRYRPLSSEQEAHLARRIRKGDRAALEKLIRSNLRFVVSVAKNYQEQGVPLEDLVSVGNMGLVKAARRFDEKKNFRFISYAVWWIRQAILQTLADQSRLFKIPLNRVSGVYKVGKASDRLVQRLHRAPSIDELADETELGRRDVELALKINRPHVSLDKPLEGDAKSVYGDVVLGDEEGHTPDEGIARESTIRALKRMLRTLNEREQEIVKRYFGIERDEPQTLDDIGRGLGLTRERVRQVKDTAMKTLRTEYMRSFLKEHMN